MQYFQVNNTATFKFIVSSVPFTSLWQHDAQKDSWAAYPTEKATVLTALHSVKNVIVLSGDRHEFAAIKFNVEGHGHSILEVSTSPLSMFYVPFVRTLHMASEVTVKTIRALEGERREAFEDAEVPQEQVLEYIAEGNYKWYVNSVSVGTLILSLMLRIAGQHLRSILETLNTLLSIWKL